MDKGTINQESVSLSNEITNKFPPWLVEMTENIKKLNHRDDYPSQPWGAFRPDREMAEKTCNSVSEVRNEQARSDNCGTISKEVKFEDIDDDMPSKAYAKNPSSFNDGLVNVSNTFGNSTPETAKTELHVRGSGFEEMRKRDRYVGRHSVEHYPQPRTKWDESDSTSRGKNRRMKSPKWRPFSMIDSQDIMINESRLVRERRASLWEMKHDPSNKISVEPIHNTFSRRSLEGTDIPIGIVKRKLDYLSGVAPREKIPEVDGKLKQDFANLVLEGSHIKPEEKPHSNKNRDNKSAKNTSKHREHLYHYERYPTKDSGRYKEFIVPELPRGKQLILDILSTWGDEHFVGLNGIEIFAATGEPATVTEVSLYLL